MNIKANKELVEKLLSVLSVKPDVLQILDCLTIGPFTISQNSTTVQGLRKNLTVTSYILDVTGDSETGDVVELFVHTDFSVIAARLVGEYAACQASKMLTKMSEEAMAQDFEDDKKQLQEAMNEGYKYYKENAPTCNADSNPYPYGIDHYKKWLLGYHKAEAEQAF